MIRVEAMSDAQFAEFRPSLAENYAQDIAANTGTDIEQACADADKEIGMLLSKGLQTLGHFLQVVRCAQTAEAIGATWWSIDQSATRAFIYYIYVAEAHRGKGYGRAIMRHLDATLGDAGIEQVSLNVFANNAAARRLYEESGFAVSNMMMTKRL
jgi:ribosomal protein S18 acetylase RimI-like enzyme